MWLPPPTLSGSGRSHPTANREANWRQAQVWSSVLRMIADRLTTTWFIKEYPAETSVTYTHLSAQAWSGLGSVDVPIELWGSQLGDATHVYSACPRQRDNSCQALEGPS
jgi:hypothetical protein